MAFDQARRLLWVGCGGGGHVSLLKMSLGGKPPINALDLYNGYVVGRIGVGKKSPTLISLSERTNKCVF